MKKILIIIGIAAFIPAICAVAMLVFPSLDSSARRAWKNENIAAISARVASPGWLADELARLGTSAKEAAGGNRWFSEDLILMRNGEWLACANICQKEDRRILDLLIARGSDGRWYYSTYHFCIRKVVLGEEAQPRDLAAFTQAFYLRAFDGQSDECLQKTWPPDSTARN